MKILFDYAAFSVQAQGGVSRCLCQLFGTVAEVKEHSVILFAGIHRNRYLKNAPPELKKKIIGFYLPEPWFKQTLFMPLNRFVFQIYARLTRPDICHFTFYESPLTPSSCKNVLTIHDMIHEKFSDYFPKNDSYTAWKRNAFRAADGVICVSENTRGDVETHYDCAGKRIITIPNGSELAKKIPKTPHHMAEEIFLLYVGSRRNRYKNFDMVLRSFAEISKTWKGNLVCFGGGGFTRDEIKRIHDLGLNERIKYRSGEDKELVAFYQRAFALVYPSTYEGFGLPPVEAMSLSCPVLSSYSPPMPEVLGDSCLYFDPNSPEDLAGKFFALQDENLRKTLVEKGKKRAELYRWDRIAKITLDFYQSLFSRGVT